MRILIYCHRIGFRTTNFIHNEIAYLDQRHEVKVLFHHESTENHYDFKNTVQVPHYEHPLLGSFKRVSSKIGLNLNSFETGLRREMETFKPDIFHIHFGNIAVRVLDYFTETNIPVLISFHGHDASRSLRDESYVSGLQKVFDRPNVFPIFVSNFMRQNVVNSGLTFNEANILYYGTDLSKFQREKRDHRKAPYVFLQVSSFVEKKGHAYTLEAFELLLRDRPEMEIKLILAGGGKLLNEMKRLAVEFGIADHVEFPGWVDTDQAKSLMERAHAFVHHSIVAADGDMEGIPNALMEAMAMELPVLSSVHSGIPELVESGKHGFLVKEKDVTSYAKKMREILHWNYLPENRERVLTHFEKEKHGQKLELIYKKYI